MIDLHCHILPYMDDGAQSLEEALEMAHLAVQSGVTDIITTPHCIDGGAQKVSRWTLELQQELVRTGSCLRLYPGMEIFGTPETAAMLRDGSLLTLNNSRYPLIEFDFISDGDQQTRILQDVQNAGYTPLIAHPERYVYVQQNPQLINLWVRMGCLLQVNKGSLLGRFGERPQRLALALVERGLAAVVGSDAHSAVVRTPWMYEVWDLLAREFAPVAAHTLLHTNPERILRNMTISSLMPDWF